MKTLAIALVFVGLVGAAPLARAAAVQPSPDVVKAAGDKLDFATWNALLEKYVDDQGRVDYPRLRGDAADRKKLETLYAQVAAERYEALPRKEKIAFLVDGYNVIVWKNVIDNQPKQVDDGLYKFFRRDYVVGGKAMDLKHLEDEVIRPLGEPRVHFALNCASGGCPILAREAFVPERLDAQLEREAKKFANEARNVSFDAAKKRWRLSHIYGWYDKDFGGKPIDFINKRRAANAQIPADAKIDYVDYDWRLNDRNLKR